MKKVLCPICGNVIRFEEKDRNLTCPVCHSLIKIKIQRAEDKIIEGAEFGIPSEQLFSDDEIIIAELDKSAPALFPEDGAALHTEKKRVPPTVGTRKEKVSTPVQLYGKEITETDKVVGPLATDDKNTKESLEERVEEERKGVLASPQPVPDSELKWVHWADIECESELLEDDELTEAVDVAKSKRKLRVPTDYRIAYLPLYAIISVISVLLLLYTPFLYIKGGAEYVFDGAKLIGGIITQGSILSQATDLYLYMAGAVLATMTVVCVLYAVYAFNTFGEYNKQTLKISNMFSAVLFLLTAALAVMLALTVTNLDTTNLTMLFSSLFIAVVLQTYVLISNLDKLPKYKDKKRVLLSPKSTSRKAYFLFGVSMLFIWSLVIGALLSLASNIAYNVLYTFDETNVLLPKLSELSLGMFGTAFQELWTDELSIAATGANYMLYSYIDYAAFACTMLVIVVYTRYAGKTASIFLEEIKPKGNENVLLEDEIKENNLARILKKSTSSSLFLYAALLTLNLAGYVVLYRGTAAPIPAVFTMISFIIAAAIRCYPYAIVAREQYMKAYVEYAEMGAEIPPMTRGQRNRLEGIPMLLVLVAYMMFIVFTLI